MATNIATLVTILEQYHIQLEALRCLQSNHYPLPEFPFFLFGMGSRPKFIYRSGELLDAHTGETVRKWQALHEWIIPPAYTVIVETSQGHIFIVEDEEGIWLIQDNQRVCLGTGHINLPDFSSHPYGLILKALHQEILINIMDGKPVPNFLVYPRPWYRDGAMMVMLLKETGNFYLVRDWILSLEDIFDRNNAGVEEADNPGQVLYLVAQISNALHPLIQKCIAGLKKFEVAGYVQGRSDFAFHPVYQTCWANMGLKALCFPDLYIIPQVQDNYAALCWWSQPNPPLADPFLLSIEYPYLNWASDHLLDRHDGPIGQLDYPLSWEKNASQANYGGMARIYPAYVQQKLAAPHTWHAAEMFFRILEFIKS